MNGHLTESYSTGLFAHHPHNNVLMERSANRRNHDRQAHSATDLMSSRTHNGDIPLKNGYYTTYTPRRTKSTNWETVDKKYTKFQENGGYHPKNGELHEISEANALNITFDNFHIRELDSSGNGLNESDAYFAGRRDVLDPSSLVESRIVSKKGTCRGFKNRVRAGIATFVDQYNDDKTRISNNANFQKNYRALEKGKIVIYTTSVTVVRETYDRCKTAKNMLQNHMVRYEERDLCLSKDNQRELMVRLGTDRIVLPQVFADGYYLGSLEQIESLNEIGELRQIFRNFTRVSISSVCDVCGGYRFTPCTVCHGSKKSLHRNNFTAEFCALRCMHCDENGLVRCTSCLDQQE